MEEKSEALRRDRGKSHNEHEYETNQTEVKNSKDENVETGGIDKSMDILRKEMDTLRKQNTMTMRTLTEFEGKWQLNEEEFKKG